MKNKHRMTLFDEFLIFMRDFIVPPEGKDKSPPRVNGLIIVGASLFLFGINVIIFFVYHHISLYVAFFSTLFLPYGLWIAVFGVKREKKFDNPAAWWAIGAWLCVLAGLGLFFLLLYMRKFLV